MAPTRYSSLHIAIHWLVALMVLVIITLPYLSEDLINQLGGPGIVFTWHKSLGLSVLLLTVLRLLLRLVTPTPAVAGDTPIQRLGVQLGHFLLYALLFSMPLSGLIFGSRPVNVFWLFEIAPLGLDEGVREAAKTFHKTAQYLLFALIIGHTLMALWHHYVRKDGLLSRMSFKG